MSTVEPGWLPDPMGRHEFRWWDGSAWTDIVADHGVETIDRLDAHQPAAPVVGQQPQPHPQLQPPAGAVPSTPGSVPASAPAPSSPDSSSGRQVALVAGLAALALIVVGAVAVAVNRGGSDGADADPATTTATAGDPRDALLTIEDMPDGWREAEVPPGEAEYVICEPGLEIGATRQAEAVFDYGDTGIWLSHVVMEVSPEQAAAIVEEHNRQVNQCGTFEDVNTVDGETWRSTITPDELTGPALGDETLWYVLHTENHSPGTGRHDMLRCLDRHGGVLSAVTITVPAPMDDLDREMVERLARTASDRLDS
ncbi:MAG TPA: DUF2510 domain-containing protein [Acidimicrobiales bacterium]